MIRTTSISLVLLAAVTAVAFAQEPPIVDAVTATDHPAVPEGLKVTCLQGPDTTQPSPTCPVIRWNGYTYWAYSYSDNSSGMAIVAYDEAGNVVGEWEKPGARYVWQIDLDSATQTVTFVGQANRTIAFTWDELFSIQTIAPAFPDAATQVKQQLAALAAPFVAVQFPDATLAELTATTVCLVEALNPLPDEVKADMLSAADFEDALDVAVGYAEEVGLGERGVPLEANLEACLAE